MQQYSHVCLGGTFDHLHAGHQRILDFAFHVGEHVSIGISTDGFVHHKKLSNVLQSFDIREEAVREYIYQNSWGDRLSIFPLDDIYGIAHTDSTIQAIIVTRETRSNAVKINNKRKANRLPPLEIVTVPFFKGKDHKIVRSERIRKGAINRIGDPYMQLFTTKRQLTLPPRLRELLRQPLGIIIEGDERFAAFTAEKAIKSILVRKPILTILVGDIVTKSLTDAGFKADIMVIDNRSRRQDISSSKKKSKNALSNPPGTIKSDVVKVLSDLIHSGESHPQSATLTIRGEEDLLALPAILLAPLGSLVVYGQAGMGIIITPVTEQKKEQIAGIIRQFE